MTSSRATVLLTGATGFVGGRILDALSALNVDVTAVARRTPERAIANVTWRSVDIEDVDGVKRLLGEANPAICVHSAWPVKNPDFWRSTENLRWVQISANLAEAFIANGGRRFVGVGTQAEYGNHSGICSEATEISSASTVYGAAKDSTRRIMEMLCRDHGVSFAWARLFSVFGPGEENYKLIPSIVRPLAQGHDAAISSGLAVRDFIDVRDAASAVARLACSEVTGVVNVGTGAGMSIAELAGRIASIMNAQDRLKIGARPDRDDEVPEIVAHPGRLVNEVGYSVFRPFEEALRDSIDYWSEKC